MGQTATIVITDLVGSTALRAELGEEAADRLRSEHDARLTAVAESHGGTVIKGTGADEQEEQPPPAAGPSGQPSRQVVLHWSR